MSVNPELATDKAEPETARLVRDMSTLQVRSERDSELNRSLGTLAHVAHIIMLTPL